MTAIERIGEEERLANGVRGLATRPNANISCGISGLTPSQLRDAFDSLSTLAIEKINEIIDSLNAGGNEKEGNILSLLHIPVKKNEDAFFTLYEFFEKAAYELHTHDDRYYTKSQADAVHGVIDTGIGATEDTTNEMNTKIVAMDERINGINAQLSGLSELLEEI